MGSDQTGEVGLVVEDACADIYEMSHLSTVHLQERVAAHLGEAKGTERHAP